MIEYMDKLPEYPCSEDMWDKLSKETRPIVCYGMGNGADKLIKRLDEYGVSIADFFASDGFVRGHSFHGKPVLSFLDIKEKYSDFVILLSFASNRDDVLEMICAIDREYDLYIPDMPVAGDEYFDRTFFNSNYDNILKAYNALSDDESKAVFARIISYKLFGRLKYLEYAFSDKASLYSVLPCDKIKNIIDAGAYNGDTIREAKEYFPGLSSVIAIEPDKRNFKKLGKYIEAECDISINSINAAVWFENADGVLSGSGNRNSTLASTASYEHRDDLVSLVQIDGLSEKKVDYIKFDVEGAELFGLKGSDKTIRADSPALLVSAYHRSEDIFSLVNYLSENYPFYDLYLRRLRCVPAWELDILAVSKE